MKLNKSICLGLGIALVLFLTILSMTAELNAEELSWKFFESESGRFSILMPGMPSFSSKESISPVGVIGEHLYCFENGVITVSASFTDLPGLAAIFGGWKRIYRESSRAFLDEVKGQEVSAKNIALDAYQGKELIYQTEKEYGKARFFLIGKRLYVLQASVPCDEKNRSLIDLYLDSFKPIYRKIRNKHHT